MSKYDDEGWACFFLQHAGRLKKHGWVMVIHCKPSGLQKD